MRRTLRATRQLPAQPPQDFWNAVADVRFLVGIVVGECWNAATTSTARSTTRSITRSTATTTTMRMTTKRCCCCCCCSSSGGGWFRILWLATLLTITCHAYSVRTASSARPFSAVARRRHITTNALPRQEQQQQQPQRSNDDNNDNNNDNNNSSNNSSRDRLTRDPKEQDDSDYDDDDDDEDHIVSRKTFSLLESSSSSSSSSSSCRYEERQRQQRQRRQRQTTVANHRQGWESVVQRQRPLPPPPLPSTNDWGIHRVHVEFTGNKQQPHDQHRSGTDFSSSSRHTPSFPSTIEALTDDVVAALRGTWFHTAKLDPHQVHNAVWPAHRPVRPTGEVGRLGIELDGVRTLAQTSAAKSRVRTAFFHPRHEPAALRRVALALAEALSQQDWTRTAATTTTPTAAAAAATFGVTTRSPAVPVAVYFNSLQQALAATQHLARLRQRQRQQVSSNPTAYDQISIHVLTDPDCDVPDAMKQQRSSLRESDTNSTSTSSSSSSSSSEAPQATPGAKRRIGRPRKQQSPPKELGKSVHPKHGIILIVQPTDALWLEEKAASTTTTTTSTTTPPMVPAVGTVTALQKVMARATLYDLPVVLVSPRLSRLTGTRWDQSGYQQSATYGGMEPPPGPTPWMLRDFIPPVYSWIVVPNVYEADQSGSSGRLPQPHWQWEDEERSSSFVSYTGGCSMVQSVMHDRHSWHVFANVIHQHDEKQAVANLHYHYEYLASTKSSTGRPTRDVLRRLLEEFSEHALGWRDARHD